ncbi:MAG: hypothetical protein HY784_14240 [Chloroflexi bacterium]|nr:hypothetical protein [Chloroflexota bacterium]
MQAELTGLAALAETARGQLRQSIMDIWPSEITAESFAADLRRFLSEHCRSDDLALTVNVGGDFQRLPARVRRGLYRIAQEALTNTAHHAGASATSVCLQVAEGQALLQVRDDGHGFDPALALARERDREHFGLRGMQQRVAALGGQIEFLSQPGAGATVLAIVPVA